MATDQNRSGDPKRTITAPPAGPDEAVDRGNEALFADGPDGTRSVDALAPGANGATSRED